jgi:DNA replication protein DnaC
MTAPAKVSDAIRRFKEREHPCGFEGCPTLVNQFYFANMWTPEHCPRCASRLREQRSMTREERSRVEREQAGKAALTNLRVPKLYADVSLETFELHGEPEDRKAQEVALTVGRDYIASWPDVGVDRNLITLRGTYGSGKGHWAWSVCKAVAQEHAAAVAFIRLPDLIRELRASWNDSTLASESQVLTRYRKLDLLYVDEVSRHAFYGQGFQHLLDVIDHRVNNQRPTILTTNDDDATLEDILGGATMSRLNGCGGILEFGNDDWRRRDREAA